MVPTINHWVGQTNAIRQFRTALEASWNDGVRLPHMLFVGLPGLGKTELAFVARAEMAVKMHTRLAQVVNTAALMNGLLLQAADKEIVFLDEIHELPPANQTLLYTAMQGCRITVQSKENQTLTMPLNDLTIIGATTDEYKLLPPLRDRFKMVLSFVPYDVKALTTITLRRAQLMAVEIQERVALEIAKRSRGTPRLAIRLLESCQRFARSQGDENITIEHFAQTMVIDQIDSLGLDANAVRYLKCVASRNGSAVRLFNIEAAIGVHRRTIQTVIEPFLIRMGLVERVSTGRAITQRGMEHLDGVTETGAAEGMDQ